MIVEAKTMIQTDTQPTETVWGLSARELHVAFWRSRGVQVIERGSDVTIQRGADLYLLIEPDRLVWFDISKVTERMSWNGASVMRLHISMDSDQEYREKIVTDDAGNVDCVQRIYRNAKNESYRVILTRSIDHVKVWKNSQSRREAWIQIRRSLPYFRIEHWRCAGERYLATNQQSIIKYLDDLVTLWKDPDRAIKGIKEIAPGVFAPTEETLPEQTLIIEPVWLGWTEDTSPRVVVGPHCECDGNLLNNNAENKIRVLDIAEIDPSNVDQQLDEEDEPSINAINSFLKRTFDIVLSATVLLLTAPIMLIVALAIMLDDGRPIFYGHRRQTRGGPTFSCWKFRTMGRNTDRMKRELEALNKCDGPQFYIPDDPRVTRVGRVLRRFHLDELPQFWNVLIGDMSIVGPRPSPDSENQFCPAWREIRLSVRPGITGLWQVERTRAPGRDFQEWIRFDTEYVRGMSLWLDARILFKTAYRIFRRDN